MLIALDATKEGLVRQYLADRVIYISTGLWNSGGAVGRLAVLAQDKVDRAALLICEWAVMHRD